MGDPAASADITRLLRGWSEGNDGARDRLMPLVYEPLRRLAARQLRRERSNHTLQPTALINELFLLLVRQHAASWENRAHFFALAAQMMRRILVDHARSHAADKRGGGAATLVLEEDAGAEPAGSSFHPLDVLAVDEALTKLAALDADQARIVELRFFAGLTVEETGLVLDRSPRTVKREWRLAKAWLRRELS